MSRTEVGAAALSEWAESGLALLTGPLGGAPVLPARDYAAQLRSLLDTTESAAAGLGRTLDLQMELFSQRAGAFGLRRQGRVSCGGTARLLRTSDGWLVANLAREDDLGAVAAWIGGDFGADPWSALETAAQAAASVPLALAGQELGIPTAPVIKEDQVSPGCERNDPSGGVRLIRKAPGGHRRSTLGGREPILVVDLSSLWAGPLCGHLMTLVGARVVKVECLRRPDGARAGPRTFYDCLHAGQESVALDFTTVEGRGQLAMLIARADVVVEGSRPRAIDQLGIDLDQAFAENPGLVWISITAHGRESSRRNYVGFGDDAAAGAGLLGWDTAGDPLFLGDALADPVAGLMAARGAFTALAEGGGFLVETSLHRAAAEIACAPRLLEGGQSVAPTASGWSVRVNGVSVPMTAPSKPRSAGSARALGADTWKILSELR